MDYARGRSSARGGGTGEAVFDGTVEYALERELSNSRYVNVVPPERVLDTLQLMRKPPDTRVDAALGREVCLRDGGIRALLTGRVEKLDTTYVLSAALVNPADGVTVASFSEEAEGQKQVVPALRRLSNRVRETLGEELTRIRESAQKLEKVTTPSLRALQLFSQADALIAENKSDVAEQLLKQAIAEDPEFASAYNHLAWAIMNQRRPVDEYRPYAERALELSETVSERERYFIRGSYYHQLHELEKAIVPYQALLRLYPDHYWGTNNLAGVYYRLGRGQEAVLYSVRLAELRPNDFPTIAQAAQALAIWANNPDQARPYIQRAQALLSAEVVSRSFAPAVWIEFFPANEYWLRGDLEKVLSEVTRLEQKFDSDTGQQQAWFVDRMAGLYLTLGKLKTYEEWVQKYPDKVVRQERLIWLAYDQGNMQLLKELGTQVPGRVSVVQALAQAGLLSEAQRALAALEEQGVSEDALKWARGELALARGQTEKAIGLLQEFRQASPKHNHPFVGMRGLVRAWEQQGDLTRALQVLEEASREKTLAAMIGAHLPYEWMYFQMQLAELYRKVGREQEAQEIEAELRRLLAYADPDHALLRQLQATEEVAVTQNPE